MVGPDEAKGPVDALADTDAGSGGDWKFGAAAPLTDGERTLIESKAVLCARDGEGLRELAGSVGEALGRPAPLTALLHDRDAGERFQRTDQNAARCSDDIRYNVQTFVHAVDQVNVRVACGSEDDFSARRHTAGRVSGQIIGTEVGFRFDNHAGGVFVENDGA